MTLKKNLRELRAIYGLSQDDVAKAIGVSRSSVVATEKGERELSSEELGKLADFLVSISLTFYHKKSQIMRNTAK